jgi:hypothetical protein
MESIPTIQMGENSTLVDILAIYALALGLGLGRRFAAIKLRLSLKLRRELLPSDSTDMARRIQGVVHRSRPNVVDPELRVKLVYSSPSLLGPRKL